MGRPLNLMAHTNLINFYGDRLMGQRSKHDARARTNFRPIPLCQTIPHQEETQRQTREEKQKQTSTIRMEMQQACQIVVTRQKSIGSCLQPVINSRTTRHLY